MTYCCGILVRDGMVLIADTRTNAGLDNISTFRNAVRRVAHIEGPALEAADVVPRDVCDAELIYRIEPGDAHFHDLSERCQRRCERPISPFPARLTSRSTEFRRRLPLINAVG
jgi:hypothetical protein